MVVDADFERTSVTLINGVREFQSSDHWRRFIDIYQPLLLKWTRQQGIVDTAAAEILSDVYLKLIQHMPVFVYDPSRTFRGWLHRVLQNAVFDMRRKQQKLSIEYSTDLVEDTAYEERDDTNSQFSDALSNQLEKARKIALVVRNQVDERTWLAFTRTAIDGATCTDVAVELQMNLASVYTARCRVLKRLQKLASCEPFLPQV